MEFIVDQVPEAEITSPPVAIGVEKNEGGIMVYVISREEHRIGILRISRDGSMCPQLLGNNNAEFLSDMGFPIESSKVKCS